MEPITVNFEPILRDLEALCNGIAEDNDGAALAHLTNEVMHILNRTSRQIDASKQNFYGGGNGKRNSDHSYIR